MFEIRDIKYLEKELNTSLEDGLNQEVALEKLKLEGKNSLPEKKKKPLIIKFLLQFCNPMIFVLIGAAIISLCLKEWADAIIILVVIFLNSIVGTIQESKAEKALDALKKLSSPQCIVKRNGKLSEIKAEDLVTGDLVILEEGNIVPADIRLTKSINLKIDESSLTGESVPVEKDANIVLSNSVPIADKVNMAYMSTPISYGRGEGIVVAKGAKTEIGKIANMLSNNEAERTPLQKRLAELSKILGIICVVVCVLMLIIGLLHNIPAFKNWESFNPVFSELLVMSISVAVAAIPEGLPAVVTIVLAMGVTRMVKVNTIVRKLPSVETLGAVSVICTDKTGTLTQNRMTVKKVCVNNITYNVNDIKGNDDAKFLAKGMMLCSNASIKGTRFGDPTELALLDYAKIFGLEKEQVEKDSEPRIDELPFDSIRKLMSTQHKVNDKYVVYTKGALDSILKKVTRISINGIVRKISNQDIKNINESASKMAKEAYRVLAFAYHESRKINEDDLIFVGLVGMIDPPRLEAKDAVYKLKQAGVKTAMITGDHKDTAFAIAKEIGIANNIEECLSGDEINKLSADELKEKVSSVSVFARVSPQNKVDIVKAYKANDNIVAMTGDGVNDAPSLKAADIGVAMGITGTDVAKNSADMVLTDDNFASIEKAVEEGRGIYANIKKSILFLLSSNFGEVMTMFFAVLIGFPMPLLAIHILWVNLISDSLPALALGRDDIDPDNMKQKPRKASESLFANGGFAFTIFYGFVIFFITMCAFLINPISEMFELSQSFSWKHLMQALSNEEILRHSQTFAFTTLGMSQLFHMLGMSNIKKSVFNLFKSKNWMFIVALAIGILLQVLVTEMPILSDFFKTTRLSWYEWLWLLALSSIPLIIHEILVPFFKRKSLM